jgi:ATP-dependent Zn protease
LLISILIYSCTPAHRLTRLVNKYPSLIQKFDTTIYYNTSRVDTSFVFNNSSTTDTFYIQETQTKIFRYFDTLKVFQDSIRDSLIIKTHTIEIKENTKTDKNSESWYDKLVVILIFITVIMVLYLFRNAIK